MEVVGLWRYPVKSLQGQALTVVDVESDGLAGDRLWGILDDRTGRILTARRRPELLTASAQYIGDVPVISLPDGTMTNGPGHATDAVLSDWLKSPVSLVPSAGVNDGRAEYFEDATDDTSAAIEWTMPADRYVDAAPVLMLTTASLEAGRSLHPDGNWDVRRFRPNIVVAHPGAGWVEDAWVGQSVSVGTVQLSPMQPCVRCTMVTRPQLGIETDVEIFRALARHHGGLFGVWCDVVSTGTVRIGDPIGLEP